MNNTRGSISSYMSALLLDIPYLKTEIDLLFGENTIFNVI